MREKKMYGLILEDGTVKGVKNGATGRVDNMYATLFTKLVNDLGLEVSAAEIEKAGESIQIKENDKGDNHYKNYYFGSKKALCIKNDNNFIGEINLTPAETLFMVKHFNETILKDKAEKNTAEKKAMPVKRHETHDDEEAAEKRERRVKRKQFVNDVEEARKETKEILDGIKNSGKTLEGVTFISASEYEKNYKKY